MKTEPVKNSILPRVRILCLLGMQECRDETEIYNYQEIQLSKNKFINGILGDTLYRASNDNRKLDIVFFLISNESSPWNTYIFLIVLQLKTQQR